MLGILFFLQRNRDTEDVPEKIYVEVQDAEIIARLLADASCRAEIGE